MTDCRTGLVIDETPVSTAEEVDEAVSSAAITLPAWADEPVAVCIQVLFHWKSLIEQRLKELTGQAPKSSARTRTSTA